LIFQAPPTHQPVLITDILNLLLMQTPIYLWLLLVITVTSSPLAISPTTAHK
jgi:hypothetical protein